MSSTVITKGVIFPLKDGVCLEFEVYDEQLYEVTEGRIQLNHDGTLIIVSETSEDLYSLTFFSSGDILSTIEELNNFTHKHLIKFDDIEFEKGKTFVEVWFNGADTSYSMLTREEFLGQTL